MSVDHEHHGIHEKIEGLIYIMGMVKMDRCKNPPDPKYYDVIKQGYKDFAFDLKYLDDAMAAKDWEK